jgi:hypothetical protein
VAASHVSHYRNMGPEQKLEINQLFRAMILGTDVLLPRGQTAWPVYFTGNMALPKELCTIISTALKERFKSERENGD